MLHLTEKRFQWGGVEGIGPGQTRPRPLWETEQLHLTLSFPGLKPSVQQTTTSVYLENAPITYIGTFHGETKALRNSMLHVLLVEDNPADVLMVREAIRTSTVEADVLIAYDGEQALRLLTELEFRPDFIILDLNVPKFSGLQILERYRAKEGPPVLVLTSSVNPQDEKRAFELGAKEYLVKPTDLDTYLSTVRQAVERWRMGAATRAG